MSNTELAHARKILALLQRESQDRPSNAVSAAVAAAARRVQTLE
jgi:hypothetical protein